jgi:hypothetical protein
MDAALYGNISLRTGKSPLNFSSCTAFIFQPEQACINPPRSNTLVKSYSTGLGARCEWEQVTGRIASECNCEVNAALDRASGDCVCLSPYYGDGRRFCHPIGTPVWRDYYGELLTGQMGPPVRYGHGWVAVGRVMWLFGGYKDGEVGAQSVVAECQSKGLLGDLQSFSTRFHTWTSYGDTAELGGPPARAYHVMTVLGDFVFVHGGLGANCTILGDFFALDTLGTGAGSVLPAWTDLSAVANAPAPRFRHSAAAVTKSDGNGVLYVFGGRSHLDGSMFGDLHVYDIANMEWRQVLYNGGPPARACHA